MLIRLLAACLILLAAAGASAQNISGGKWIDQC